MDGKKGFCRFIIFFFPFHQRMPLFTLISHHPCILLALLCRSYVGGIREKFHLMHESTATNDDNCGALISWSTSVFESTSKIKQFFSTIFAILVLCGSFWLNYRFFVYFLLSYVPFQNAISISFEASGSAYSLAFECEFCSSKLAPLFCTAEAI